MTRRKSIKLTAITGAAVFLYPKVAQATPYTSASDAFAALGFNPSAAGNAHVVIIADIHLDPYGHNSSSPQPTLDDRLVNAIMAISPPPTRLIVDGDVAISSTGYFGKPFTELDRTRTLEELQCGKQQLLRFAPIPVDVMIGNHDGHAYDTTHAVFHEVFPDEPDYRWRDIGGVRFYELNGHHSGYVDTAQEAWLKASVDALNPLQEIVVCIHQPALGNVHNERGIACTFRRVFANHYGKIWMYAGHAHQFSRDIYELPHTTITQIGITTANPVAFNDNQNPGFMIVCLENGKVKGNIMRNCKKSYYEIFGTQIVASKPIPVPWDGAQYRMATFEEGAYNRNGVLVSFIAGDTGTWFSYTGRVVYRLPLAAYMQRADRVLFLAGNQAVPPVFEFSENNGTTWTQSHIESYINSVYTIPMPPETKAHPAPLVRVRVLADRFDANFSVAGFALAADPQTVTSIEAWRHQYFGTLFSEGDAADLANPSQDGLCNLLKFAFGLNPTICDRRLLGDPSLGGEPNILITNEAVTLRYLRRIGAGLTYQAQSSTDLQQWKNVITNESVVPVNATWELVTALPLALGEKRFWRVAVTA